MTDLPEDVVDDAERLTRLARDAVDDNAADAYRTQRDALLADHDHVARYRDADQTLVCYPEDWLDEQDRVDTETIEDTDRAAEVSLAGRGDQGDYETAAEHNEVLAKRVREAYGDVHGDTADAFATFMSNHYARPMETASDEERAEFREEYFPRNAWPSDEQLAQVEETLALVEDLAAKHAQ